MKEWKLISRFVILNSMKDIMKKPSKEKMWRVNQQMRLCITLFPVVPYGQ